MKINDILQEFLDTGKEPVLEDVIALLGQPKTVMNLERRGASAVWCHYKFWNLGELGQLEYYPEDDKWYYDT